MVTKFVAIAIDQLSKQTNRCLRQNTPTPFELDNWYSKPQALSSEVQLRGLKAQLRGLKVQLRGLKVKRSPF
ncbi:hypothetical protein H1Q63_33160 [Desmonostoc muscorum CCALA 125]|nr:hypothetical protein [Desmonostoc muscorum CCALA 125]